MFWAAAKAYWDGFVTWTDAGTVSYTSCAAYNTGNLGFDARMCTNADLLVLVLLHVSCWTGRYDCRYLADDAMVCAKHDPGTARGAGGATICQLLLVGSFGRPSIR